MGQDSITIYQLIDKKKRGRELKQDEMRWFIQSLMDGKIEDYQTSALLMAMFIQQLSIEETAYLTDAMLYSGRTLHFDDPTVVDKHSTGGIGDKASFVLAPIAAAAGVKVPMIAGRGLGFTGGTVDKIESIAGFQTAMDLDSFSKQLKEHGIVLIGQTKDIAPADKILYGLRDVTATIDSIPLITASIMSKKLAEGANGIVMDIKVGNGAFMRNKTEAKKLAKSIIRTAKRFDKKAVAILSNMDQPLGNKVGHSLEIEESIETLKGNGPKDLESLSLELASHMIHLAGIEKSITKSRAKAKSVLESGKALEKFKELIKLQGGNPEVVNRPDMLPRCSETTTINSPIKGYLKNFQNDQIGMICTELGGGRKKKSDTIDFAVGLDFHKKVGDKLKVGEPLVTIHHHSKQKELVDTVLAPKLAKQLIKFSTQKVAKAQTIYDILS